MVATVPGTIYKNFCKPFPGDVIEWRAQGKVGGSGRVLALAYLQARAVMDRLDEVVGPNNWHDSYFYGPKGQVICSLSVRFGGDEAGEWITKTDGSEETAVESVKGGLSGAFKRAAVKFGIGRYLYALGDTWVDAEQKGKYVNFLQAPLLPAWALPDDVDYDNYVKEQKDRFRTTKAARAPKAKQGADKPKPASQPAPTPATAEAGPEVSDDTRLARAKGYKIPKGLPLAGKTYEEALKTELGQKILLYLARRQPNKAGDLFEPTDTQQAQHNAAIYIVGVTPSLEALDKRMSASE